MVDSVKIGTRILNAYVLYRKCLARILTLFKKCQIIVIGGIPQPPQGCCFKTGNFGVNYFPRFRSPAHFLS